MPHILLLLLGLLLFLFPASALGETKIMVVSDPHYLTPELYEGSDLFVRALRAGDGKISQYGEELMAALVEEVRRQQPDALVVTGDLSFNGEKASHEKLADWFHRIEENGTPVWVIPGNHDINSSTPRAFGNNTWRYVSAATEEDFARIYADFLLPKEGGANANFSYHVPISDQLWLALTDGSYYRHGGQVFGLFSNDHAAWLEGVLSDAAAAGVQVVTATHHSLIPHTQFARDSFVLFGSEAMQRLMLRYGAKLNLSGHLHIQHIISQSGLTDAATGAFCVFPHRFALVTLDDEGRLSYAACALEDDLLPDGFQAMSREWFYSITVEKNRAALKDKAIPAADLETMLDFSGRFNAAYFSGLYRSDDPAWKEESGYRLWQQYSGDTFGAYLGMVMDEPSGDSLFWRAP